MATKKASSKKSSQQKEVSSKKAAEVSAQEVAKKSPAKKSSCKKSSAKKSSAKKSSGRKYSKGAGKQVKREMHEMHRGQAEERPQWKEGNEPQAGHRDRAFRSPQEGRKGSAQPKQVSTEIQARLCPSGTMTAPFLLLNFEGVYWSSSRGGSARLRDDPQAARPT